jgi:hypothetical protein
MQAYETFPNELFRVPIHDDHGNFRRGNQWYLAETKKNDFRARLSKNWLSGKGEKTESCGWRVGRQSGAAKASRKMPIHKPQKEIQHDEDLFTTAICRSELELTLSNAVCQLSKSALGA